MKKLNIKEIKERVNRYSFYDTSLIDGIINNKVHLICHKKDDNGNEHGDFWQSIGHLKEGHGCPKCGIENRCLKRRKGKSSFIEEAKKVHGDKYDYSKVEYINVHTKVCIICAEHGEFWQTPASHLMGRNCPKCSFEKHPHRKITNNEFIQKAKKVHGDKYDYSKVDYKDIKTKVCIICPIHGEYWQIPQYHLRGNGCKYCKESHLEGDIRKLLTENKIPFYYEQHFEWLKFRRKMSLDFFLPDYNIAIECQGEQHFKLCDFSSKTPLEEQMKMFEKIKTRDEIKYALCKQHNIKVIYYSYYKYNKDIITDLNEILNFIRKWKK